MRDRDRFVRAAIGIVGLGVLGWLLLTLSKRNEIPSSDPGDFGAVPQSGAQRQEGRGDPARSAARGSGAPRPSAAARRAVTDDESRTAAGATRGASNTANPVAGGALGGDGTPGESLPGHEPGASDDATLPDGSRRSTGVSVVNRADGSVALAPRITLSVDPNSRVRYQSVRLISVIENRDERGLEVVSSTAFLDGPGVSYRLSFDTAGTKQPTAGIWVRRKKPGDGPDSSGWDDVPATALPPGGTVFSASVEGLSHFVPETGELDGARIGHATERAGRIRIEAVLLDESGEVVASSPEVVVSVAEPSATDLAAMQRLEDEELLWFLGDSMISGSAGMQLRDADAERLEQFLADFPNSVYVHEVRFALGCGVMRANPDRAEELLRLVRGDPNAGFFSTYALQALGELYTRLRRDGDLELVREELRPMLSDYPELRPRFRLLGTSALKPIR